MHIYFAPLEGITTYNYRNLHHKYFVGVEKYYTPFLSPGPDQGMSVKEVRDALPENNEGVPVVPQILTNRSGDFLAAARQLLDFGYEEINLNLGCPSGTVTAKKKGSGFLSDTDGLERFFEEVFSDELVKNGEVRVSVKTRIGKNSPEEWPELMRIYNQYPICELTIHPRIRTDFYKNTPNLAAFADALAESRNPVVYNGDLFTAADVAVFRKKFPTVDRLMLGRGLIRNPGLGERILGEELSAVAGARASMGPELPSGAGDQLRAAPYPLRLRAFHDELLAQYQERMSGDRNVLFKMKDLWKFMLEEFPDCGKLEKKLRKSQHLDEYMAIVDELFAKLWYNEKPDRPMT